MVKKLGEGKICGEEGWLEALVRRTFTPSEDSLPLRFPEHCTASRYDMGTEIGEVFRVYFQRRDAFGRFSASRPCVKVCDLVIMALKALGTPLPQEWFHVRPSHAPRFDQALSDSLGQCSPLERKLGFPLDEVRDLAKFKHVAGLARRLNLISAVLDDAPLRFAFEEFLPKSYEGILTMSKSMIEKAMGDRQFRKLASSMLFDALQKHRESDVNSVDASFDAKATNSKFMSEGGFVGSFGDDKLFYGGLEDAIGLPDPRVTKAIIREHTSSEGSEHGFLTSNYLLWTSPRSELAYIFGGEDDFEYLKELSQGKHHAKGPSWRELQDLQREFEALQNVSNQQQLFPGETGFGGCETEITAYLSPDVTTISPASVRKQILDAEIVSKDDIECLERFSRSAVMVDSKQNRIVLVFHMKLQDIDLDKQEAIRNALENSCSMGICKVLGDLQIEERPYTFVECCDGKVKSTRQGRRRLSLRQLMSLPQVIEANLRVEEAVAAYLYTGPMYMKYNGVLRNITRTAQLSADNLFTTTLHCLVSATLKLSRRTIVPKDRKLWRGLGGMVLNERFFTNDFRGTRGGVELGFLSTTVNKEVAMTYSGQDKHRGTVLQLDFGKVDCPARFDDLSQYPGEGEMLFSPLSNLEVVGDPCLETYKGEKVLVVPIRINSNLKAHTIEEMIGKRKQSLIVSLKNLITEIKSGLHKFPEMISFNGTEVDIRKFHDKTIKAQSLELQDSLQDMHSLLEDFRSRAAESFNDDEEFRKGWNEALDRKNRTMIWCWITMLLLADSPLEFNAIKGFIEEKFTRNALEDIAKRKSRNCKSIEWSGEKVVHINATEGDSDGILLLLLSGVSPSTIEELKNRALLVASQEGDELGVQTLLNEQPGVASGDVNFNESGTALHFAHTPAVARMLLNAKACVEAKDSNDCTALHAAAKECRGGVIGVLLEGNANVNAQDNKGQAPLHKAAETAGIDIVSTLLAAKAMLELKDKSGKVALHYASERGACDVAAAIIAFEADVSAVDNFGWTALHTAAKTDNSEMVRLMILHDADPHARNSEGAAASTLTSSSACREILTWTPLMAAVDIGDLLAVKMVMDRSANVNAGNGKNTALHMAAEKGDTDIVRALLHGKVDANIRDEKGATPLFKAISVDVVRALVEGGADVLWKCIGDLTALHTAAEAGHVEVVKALLEAKADANSEDVDGRVPLHCSTKERHLEIVCALLDAKADIAVKNKEGLTALHLASETGDCTMVETMLGANAYPDPKDLGGHTPLHIASRMGHQSVVCALLSYSADALAENKDAKTALDCAQDESCMQALHRVVSKGWSALMMAVERGSTGRVQALLNEGVDMNVQSRDGCSALELATRNESRDIVRMLLDRKADPNVIDSDGSSALHHWSARDDFVIVQLLVNAKADVRLRDRAHHSALDLARDDACRDTLMLAQAGVTIPLLSAAIEGDLRQLEALITVGTALNDKVHELGTVLHVVAHKGDTETASWLLANKANINAINKFERTPLHLAATQGNHATVRMLIEAQADIHVKDFEKRSALDCTKDTKTRDIIRQHAAGWTPLMRAAERDASGGEVKAALEMGELVNAQSTSDGTALHIAARKGHARCVFMLLMNEANPEERDRDGRTSLDVAQDEICSAILVRITKQRWSLIMIAVANEYKIGLRTLLERGADVNAQNCDQRTALHLASMQGSADMIFSLIFHNADVSTKDRDGKSALDLCKDDICKEPLSLIDLHGWTPLMLAAREGSIESLKVLLARGADVNANAMDLSTALHVSAKKGCLHSTTLLIAHSADVNAIDSNGMTPMDRANSSACKALLKQVSCDGWTPLMIAVQQGYTDEVLLAIDKGMDVNATAVDGSTALHVASDCGHAGLVSLLIIHNADIMLRDKMGKTATEIARGDACRKIFEEERTPLMMAVLAENKSRVKTLLQQNVDVDTTDCYGATALHLASAKDCSELVVELIQSKANVDIQDKNLRTPLHLASSTETARALIDGRANLEMQDKEGYTALHSACQAGNINVVQGLLAARADLGARCKSGKSPVAVCLSDGCRDEVRLAGGDGWTKLMCAASKGDTKAMVTLLESGADVHARDQNEQTALHKASKAGKTEAVFLLLICGADVHSEDNCSRSASALSENDACARILELFVGIYAQHRFRRKRMLEAQSSKADGNLNELSIDWDEKEIMETLEESEASAKLLASNTWKTTKELVSSGVFSLDLPQWALSSDISWRLLSIAIERNFASCTAALIAQGALFLLEKYFNKCFPLHLASEKGNVEAVYLLAAHMERVDQKNNDGKSAREVSKDAVCRQLLKVIAIDSWSPLMIASSKGDIRLVRELMGSDVNAKSRYGCSALHFASAKGFVDVVQELVRVQMADVLICDMQQRTALHVAKTAEVAVTLIEGMADLEARDLDGHTALHCAARCGRDDVVRELLRAKADVMAENTNSLTALDVAEDECCRAELRRAGGNGWTPLMNAAANGDLLGVHTMLDQGEGINEQDKLGQGALHKAAERGHAEIVSLLLQSGAEVNMVDKKGNTPLHLAAEYGNGGAVHVLIVNHADIHAKDNEGKVPLDLAKGGRSKELLEHVASGGWNALLHLMPPTTPISRAFTPTPDFHDGDHWKNAMARLKSEARKWPS